MTISKTKEQTRLAAMTSYARDLRTLVAVLEESGEKRRDLQQSLISAGDSVSAFSRRDAECSIQRYEIEMETTLGRIEETIKKINEYR